MLGILTCYRRWCLSRYLPTPNSAHETEHFSLWDQTNTEIVKKTAASKLISRLDFAYHTKCFIFQLTSAWTASYHESVFWTCFGPLGGDTGLYRSKPLDASDPHLRGCYFHVDHAKHPKYPCGMFLISQSTESIAVSIDWFCVPHAKGEPRFGVQSDAASQNNLYYAICRLRSEGGPIRRKKKILAFHCGTCLLLIMWCKLLKYQI